MNLKVTICIDDVHPDKNWRILRDKTEEWLNQLNKDFGAKFTLFIPSNYHGRFPLSKHKGWINELNSDPKFELAAHGHYHQTTDPQNFGECEFFEIKHVEKAYERVLMIYDEWMKCGLGSDKLGWRNPGWLCSEGSKAVLQRNFKYAAIHYEHNRGLEWNCKTFFGHDGIQQANISIHDEDMIMFQSHIAGNHNHNVWNEDNYNQLRLSLEYLTTNYDCEFKTLNECL